MNYQLLTLGSLQAALLDSSQNPKNENWEHLLPHEEIEIAHTFKHPLRRSEFLKGRLILHQLQPLLPPVLQADDGSPIWPTGFAGSISHKEGNVVASIIPSTELRGVGVDIEDVENMPLRLAKAICRDEEIFLLKKLPLEEQRRFLTLVFSTKEALFKCCYPSSRIWFGHHDAILVDYDWSDKTFTLKLLKDLLPQFKKGEIFRGNFLWLSIQKKLYLLTFLSIFLVPFPGFAHTQGNSRYHP